MKNRICNFIAILNQSVKLKKSKFKVRFFRQAPLLIQALINAGYIQYYISSNQYLIIYLRITKEGPVLSYVKQNSKPSKKNFFRCKFYKQTNKLTLLLVDRQILTTFEAKAQNKGGVLLLDIL